MAKVKVDVDVPFEFCEKCKMCVIREESYDVSELGGLATRQVTKHFCDNYWACSNAVYLYKENEKEEQNATNNN